MNFFVILCLFLEIYFVNGKDVKLVFDDQIYDCEDSKEPYSKYIDATKFEFNQIDDESVELNGKFIIKYTFPNEPWHMFIRTEFLNHGTWTEAPIYLQLQNACREFQNPTKFWYNYTKNMGVNGCPPKEGDVWIIDRQILRIIVPNVPNATPDGKWSSYNYIYQGLTKKNKFCFKFNLDVISLK